MLLNIALLQAGGNKKKIKKKEQNTLQTVPKLVFKQKLRMQTAVIKAGSF